MQSKASVFQSTHPRGVRRRGDRQCHSLASFQSTHPRGVRPRRPWPGRRPRQFQSTHPRGVRRGNAGNCSHYAGVSIHAPAWGATWPAWRCGSRSRCFNPRTRVGCDAAGGELGVFGDLFQSTHPRGVRLITTGGSLEHFRVSIHAPAWGATKKSSKVKGLSSVSIHAPAWGATGMLLHNCDKYLKVSIHAPAWGATCIGCIKNTPISCFNPRTRVGCDVESEKYLLVLRSFNPRTRVGCDMFRFVKNESTKTVSIHAPAWGATPALFALCRGRPVSIHAPAWGATPAYGCGQ